MPKIEILAPVGSEEMLRAAVFSGADAVYLGFSGFNARTGAGNFDADSLKEAVRFCHARGVKVHVALNTTVYGGELAALAGAVKAVAESGADAVIFDNPVNIKEMNRVDDLIHQKGTDIDHGSGTPATDQQRPEFSPRIGAIVADIAHDTHRIAQIPACTHLSASRARWQRAERWRCRRPA